MLWKAESVIMVLARLDSSEPCPLALRRVDPLVLSSCLPPPTLWCLFHNPFFLGHWSPWMKGKHLTSFQPSHLFNIFPNTAMSELLAPDLPHMNLEESWIDYVTHD